METDATGWSAFRGDLEKSVGAIGAAPMLVVLSTILNIAFYVSGPITVVALPLLLVEVGFVGTQRVWFARIYGGTSLEGREITRLTRSFIVRFVTLGLLLVAALSPFTLLAHPPHGQLQRGWAAAVVAMVLVLDIGLTFVVPALALTTRSVSDALRIGQRMIRRAWPTSAWYLLTPGLTLGLLGAVLGHSSLTIDVPLQIALLVSTSILSVWFKGAIVAFYIRQPPIPGRTSRATAGEAAAR